MPSSESGNNESIKANVRNLGLYIAGLPGRGKTSLIQNLIIDDISHGSGVCIVDPAGDLIEDIIHYIPLQREKDIILFETRNPLPLDLFSYKDADERTLLVDMLMGIFDLENAPVATPRLERIINTLFDVNDYLDKHEPDNIEARCTFLDIREFIENPTRQKQIFKYAPQREIGWKAQGLKPSDFMPIWERMSHFFENPALKTIFGSRKPVLRIADVLAKNQVLLVNLRGTRTDYDIAALIVAKFHQALFALRDIPKRERQPFYFYIDECHRVISFVEKEADEFLTGGRKFNLCLTLANQFPSDLPGKVKENIRALQSAILFKLTPDKLGPFVHAFPKPVPKLDRSRERERLIQQFNEARSRHQEIWSIGPNESMADVYGQAGGEAKIREAQRLGEKGMNLRKQIERLDTDVANAKVVPDWITIVANLPVGEAVYLPEQGEPSLIAVRRHLQEHDKDDGCAEYLRNRTLDNYPCNPLTVPHDERTTPVATLDDEIPPDPNGPNISPYKGKKKNA